jgi:hypothetical protein
VFISANTLCFLKCLHSCVLVVRCRLLLCTPVYPYKVLHVLGGRCRREIAKETLDVILGVGCKTVTQQGFRGQIDFPGNLFQVRIDSCRGCTSSMGTEISEIERVSASEDAAAWGISAGF